MTLDDLRRTAVARTLFTPTTLQGALDRLGFVQADPIRAPARAQDLTLRHRVVGLPCRRSRAALRRARRRGGLLRQLRFRAGAIQALMHPRAGRCRGGRQPADVCVRCSSSSARAERCIPATWTAFLTRHGHQLLGRLVERHDAPARRDALPRPAARGPREAGIRVYAAHEHAPGRAMPRRARAHLDALVDVIVGSTRHCRRRACRHW